GRPQFGALVRDGHRRVTGRRFLRSSHVNLPHARQARSEAAEEHSGSQPADAHLGKARRVEERRAGSGGCEGAGRLIVLVSEEQPSGGAEQLEYGSTFGRAGAASLVNGRDKVERILSGARTENSLLVGLGSQVERSMMRRGARRHSVAMLPVMHM